MFSDILLKAVPPKAPTGFVVRPTLMLDRFRLAGIQLIELCAPEGFGKTSQLAQWHREATAAGVAVIWLSLDERDEVPRLIHALAAAARATHGRKAGRDFRDWMGGASDHQEALTRWLAEVSQSSQESLLLLDDVDYLPLQSRQEVIQYLLANSANNLRIVVSSRPNASALSGRTIGSAPMIRLTARELRFQEHETTAVVSHALPGLSHADTAELSVRIHALTEGWPLGVRLAIAARLHSGTSADWERSMSANMDRYFRESLLEGLAKGTLAMLVKIADLDPIHPELCRAVLGTDAPVDQLHRLVDESPVLTQAREGGWLRLHPIARDILAQMQVLLPEAERRGLARAAGRWYECSGQLEAAARQAILADDRLGAMRLAEASLRNMLVQGRLAEVLDWHGRASAAELARRPGFWAPAAWALTMSNRRDEALLLVRRIVEQEDLTEEARFEAHLIRATAAGYDDDQEQLDAFLALWPQPPAFAGPGEIAIHATSRANHDLICGQTADLRSRLNEAALDGLGGSPVARGFGDLFFGLSYLWEGKPQLAYESLREALARAEAQMERSNRVVTMIAAALAQASLETGRPDEARLHLALRLPVLERQGLPDAMIAAFCTHAELVADDGRQDHAEVQFESLIAIGRSRGLVRVQAAALLGLARLHGRHGRMTAAVEAADRLDALGAARPARTMPEVALWVTLHARMAAAWACAADAGPDRLAAGVAATEAAMAIGRQLNRGADVARAWLLRAAMLAALGTPVDPREVAEVASQCEAVGLVRPLAAVGIGLPGGGAAAPPGGDVLAGGPAAEGDAFLTPREHDILTRLVVRMSNKEIALAMGLGEETVKWHLKNLFRKLEAGDRRSAVLRARGLGLI